MAKKIYVTTGNLKTITRWKKEGKVMVPYMSSECKAAVKLNLENLLLCELLIVKQDYVHLDKDRLTEIYVAQQLGIKVVYEGLEKEFDFDLSINSERRSDG